MPQKFPEFNLIMVELSGIAISNVTILSSTHYSAPNVWPVICYIIGFPYSGGSC